MKAIYDPIVIFSVHRKAVPQTLNQWAHESTRRLLEAEGIPYQIVDGYYKGESERSFMVNGRYQSKILEIAIEYAQESVLLVHGDRFAELLNPKTGLVIQGLGKFQEAKACETLGLESYTRTLDGKIWVAK